MNYHVLNNSIVLNYLGKTTVVSKDDEERYEGVLACIRENRLNDIPAVVEIERGFEGTGLELKDGLLYENNIPMPAELNARILAYKEQGLPFDSLMKFWENLKLNPSYNSKQMLYKFLEHNGHPFTEDGCFIAYRGVTSDFKDMRTGNFDNSVGAVCEEDRALVDDNPNNTCSRGLHVACFDYAKGFGPTLIEVKVNPRDVVAVPTDYNGTKMRTCRFEVVAVGENLRNEVLYGNPAPMEEEVEEVDENEEVSEYACDACGHGDGELFNYCPNCGEEQD